MSNLYSTTLWTGYFLVGAGVTASVSQTVGPLFGPAASNRKKLKFAENNDFTGEEDIAVLAENLQLLNPEEEIRILSKKQPGAKNIIFASTSIDNLELPNGFERDPNGTHLPDGFSTIIDPTTGTYNKILVIDMNIVADRDALEEKLQPKFEKEKVELSNLKSAASTTGALVSTSITYSLIPNTYAATYDAKTYMDALSDDQVVEFATDLEKVSLDDLDLMLAEEPQEVSVKKLVK